MRPISSCKIYIFKLLLLCCIYTGRNKLKNCNFAAQFICLIKQLKINSL
jgi:hypothetical protein